MRIKINDRLYKICCLLCLITILAACEKLVEVNAPITSSNRENVFEDNVTAAAVLTNIYMQMSAARFSQGNALTPLSLYTGLSGDELELYKGVTGNYVFFYKNLLTGSTAPNFWVDPYLLIYTANSAIEGIMASAGLTPVVKTQLLGEARFMRAFCYFYLVNLYGDTPLALTTNFRANTLLPRVKKELVYEQIVADLKEAKNLLNAAFVSADAQSPTTERVRPTKWAAMALLSRVYLYMGNYAGAEAEATGVIDHSSLFSLIGLDSIFLKNSNEAIFQLQPVNNGWNTEDARIFVIPPTGPSAEWPVYLSRGLLNSFEPGDQRRVKWINKYTDTVPSPHIDYYYPYKYKRAVFGDPVTEYHTILRLAEQYLIRAEARAQQGNTTGAQSDLNRVRTRTGLSNTNAAGKQALLDAIARERRVELFCEWGHRWLDLKRTNTIDQVMTEAAPLKGTSWNTNWQWYPILFVDLERGPNLVQNAGY